MAKNLYLSNGKPKLDKIRELRGNGATQVQIASFLGVNVNTVYKWILTYPEFKQAMDDGLQIQVDNLQGKLYQLAMGGQKVKKKESVKRTDKDGNVSIEETNTETELPPDRGALLNLMANHTLAAERDHWLTDPDAYTARMKELEHKKEQDSW